jgi:serine/threonine protein kinase
VVACSHIGSRRLFACKVQRSSRADLLYEASVLDRLRGVPGVPSVYAFGYWRDATVLITHGVGESALNLMRRTGDLPIATIESIAISVCAQLRLVHDRGLLHCDISPSNIMFCDGVWGLIDFGSAGPIGRVDVDQKTGQRSFLFTPDFASEGLLLTGFPLSEDDDFESLEYSLSWLHSAHARAKRGSCGESWSRQVVPAVRELVVSQRTTSKAKGD